MRRRLASVLAAALMLALLAACGAPEYDNDTPPEARPGHVEML